MSEIRIGVLIISDRCSSGKAVDESGENLMKMMKNGIIPNGEVVKYRLVSDDKEKIISVLSEWCGKEEDIHLILTVGGTGLSERDVTPEATSEILEKYVPGIPSLIFKRCSEITDLACLSRGVAGVAEKTLIINLPGSKKASMECLEAVSGVVPHAVDLILERTADVKLVHEALSSKKSSVVRNVAERPRISPYPCITVEKAQKIIKDRVLLLRREEIISCKRALNYVSAEAVRAADDLPPFDASLKDGYAASSYDKMEVRNVIGVSKVGSPPDVSVTTVSVTTGCCVRISTGAAIPVGADVVIPVESTSLIEKDDNEEEKKIKINDFYEKGANIRQRGSDFSRGQIVLPCNAYLGESALGLLAAVGVTTVRVYHKPLVAIFSTGNELIDPEEKIQPGKVRDSNRATLINLLKNEFFEAVDLGICPDHPDALRDFLERGFQTADVVVTTGNMSMGDQDYLKEVLFADFKAEILFGRVLMKPGKPTAFGMITFEGKPKLWFGLPGNPASAFVTSHLFLLPALRLISNQKNVFPSSLLADLSNVSVTFEDRPQYVRGSLKYSYTTGWCATLNENQQSSSIRGCVDSNCLVLIPSKDEALNDLFDEGKKVRALLIGKPHFEK